MKKIASETIKSGWLLAVLLMAPLLSFAQPLSGLKKIGQNVGDDYSTVAAAVAALNSQGVTAPGVTFSIDPYLFWGMPLSSSETLNTVLSINFPLAVPHSTANAPIVFQNTTGLAYTIVAPDNGSVGNTPSSATQDGIWNLQGSSYVTIDGFTLVENSSNSGNGLMEYGFALYKSKPFSFTPVTGSQNNTIKNCTISLNRNNVTAGTFADGSAGIIVVNTLVDAATTAISCTAATESNSSNKFIGNIIQNCNVGIALIGAPGTVVLHNGADFGNTIGGITAPLPNTITNFGGGSGAVTEAAGIVTSAQYNLNITGNTINNNVPGGTGVDAKNTIRGIYNKNATGADPTIISNNTITLQSAATSADIIGIDNAAHIGGNIDLNTITACNYTGLSTGNFYGIRNTGTATILSISSNNVNGNGNTLGGTGTFTGIDAGNSTSLIMDGNTVKNNTKLGAGEMYCISAGTSAITYTNNTISDNTCSNSSNLPSNICGYYNFASPTSEIVDNNTISNLIIKGVNTSLLNSIYGLFTNTISTDQTMISRNKINGLSYISTGANSVANVYGMRILKGATINISKNEIRNLSARGTASTITGLYVNNGTTWNISNNMIGDLRASSSSNANAIQGIHINGTGTFSVL